jgi:hypothetical protein
MEKIQARVGGGVMMRDTGASLRPAEGCTWRAAVIVGAESGLVFIWV